LTYDPNIPAPTDRLSVSQGQMQQNFSALDTVFGENHIPFSTPTDAGEHTKITINEPLGADPGATGAKAQVYTKTVLGNSELFFQNSTNIQQLTGTSNASPEGSSTLLGGAIIKWGKRASVPSGTSIVFPIPFPTATFSLVLTAEDTGGETNVTFSSLTSVGFTLHASGTPVTFDYVAIGY